MDGSMKKLWAWDSANKVWVKLTVDADGYIKVVGLDDILKTSDLNLDVAGDLQVDVKSQVDKDRNTYGHDGTDWQKLGLLFGYNDTYQDAAGDNAAGGDLIVLLAAVPAGYIYIVNNLIAQNTTRGGTNGKIMKLVGVAEYVLSTKVGLAQHETVVFQGTLVLKEGDRVRAYFWGLTVGDHIDIIAVGYKMKIS